MKKILAIAFIGGLIMASCAKKEETTDMNSTMAEPMVEDSTMVTADSAAVDSTAVVAPVVTDSADVK